MSYLKVFNAISLGLILGVSLTACGLGESSWKEEVLLHDGSKLIVERSQTYGGNHELGQLLPIKEQIISFTIPKINKLITWKSEYSEDVGRSNFNLHAIHILNSTPYIIASPNLCLSYNKWGRPNPPYVYFKYVDNIWRRIKLEELPHEFTTFNVVQNTLNYKHDEEGAKLLTKLAYVTVDKVKELNGKPAFNVIRREPKEKTECLDWSSSGPKAPPPKTPLGNSNNQH